MLTSNAFPNAFIVDNFIPSLPLVSNFEIVTLLIPAISASSSCVIPFSSLIFLRLFSKLSPHFFHRMLTIVNFMLSIRSFFLLVNSTLQKYIF